MDARPLILTDRQVALCPFPELPQHESQRQSSSRTQPARPRTFRELRIWESFCTNARNLSMALTDELELSIPHLVNPIIAARDGLEVATSEVYVQGTIEHILFPLVNDLAKKMGLRLRYGDAGSGRSCSRTDIVIYDKFLGQNINNLSERVYGIGEIKGSWQWEVTDQPYAQQILDEKKQEMLLKVAQQMFGDMVLDEAIVGFISNYNQTVFFYRDEAHSKSLYFSPLVRIGDAPVEKFLYVLQVAENLRNIKVELSRDVVEVTPTTGYQLEGVTDYSSSGRRIRRRIHVNAQPRSFRSHVRRRSINENTEESLPIYGELEISHIPVYKFGEIGMTGGVVGLGKYGNVFTGALLQCKVAIKTFDAREELAVRSFVAEQIAYKELKSLQGVCIPHLLFVGRLPHTLLLFLALSNEKGRTTVKDAVCDKRLGERCRSSIRDALAALHNLRVVHGDLNYSNMLWNNGRAYLIDFEYSKVEAKDDELLQEVNSLELLLQKA